MFAVRVCVVCAVSAVAVSRGRVADAVGAARQMPTRPLCWPTAVRTATAVWPTRPERDRRSRRRPRERESGAEVSNYTVRGLIRVIYRERCTGPYTALQYTPHHNISARRAAVPRQLSVLRVDELHAPQQHLQPGAVAP